MARFLFVYQGGRQPATPEEGKQQYAEYREWLSSLKETIVVPETPVKNTHTVKPDGSVVKGGDMMGYIVMEAVSLDAAVEIAQRCPFLKTGGSMEVSELMEMPGR